MGRRDEYEVDGGCDGDEDEVNVEGPAPACGAVGEGATDDGAKDATCGRDIVSECWKGGREMVCTNLRPTRGW